ncbi:MAG: tyrosine-type recombinase/integrase [Candidatus Competibacter sp.]|nr:tyrosine-type recombinase/integrase [Candidatus Competibacter sp.]MDG4583185.1 tyrosine-type recombinase/integrase [Candidatus Competibacter sp.]
MTDLPTPETLAVTTSALAMSTALAPVLQPYIEAALADRTRQEYRADLRRFLRWGGMLPASPERLAAYLVAHATDHAMATLQRWLVSLGRAHTTQSWPDPTKSELVKTTFKGIRRRHGRPQRQVAPLLRDDLVALLRALDEETLSGRRNRALLLLGFAGALRRSELVGLHLGDLQFSTSGLTLHLRHSKTDQEHRGRLIGIPFARDPRHCPVGAVRAWRDTLQRHDSASLPESPLFRAINRHGQVAETALTGRAVALIIQSCCRNAGLNPSQYAGHSLRAGFCTAAALAGKPNWQIRKQSGHKTDVMLNRYIREGRLFADHPLEGVL